MERNRIFISYSHQDSACAMGIARYLSRRGCDVWIDSEQLSLGQNWAESIDAALGCADAVIGILSAGAVRRPQVIREIGVALDRLEAEGVDRFRLFFVVIGPVHTAWFRGQESARRRLADYFSAYQFIQLNAHGDVTIAAMRQLDAALEGSGIRRSVSPPADEPDSAAYILASGMPEKVEREGGGRPFYRVDPADLAPSCVFPFALDNQWLPVQIGPAAPELNADFSVNGFSGPLVRELVTRYQRYNFYLSLIHSRQVILNRASILNSLYFHQLITADARDGSEASETRAFRQLLEDGSIVVFLYGDGEVAPDVKHTPKYSTAKDAVAGWNRLCAETTMFCIRENWENPVDQHSVDLLRFCSTFAADADTNRMIAANLHLFGQNVDPFLAVLKTIEMQVFCQAHMNGTGKPTEVSGYSRSAFYRDYVVKDAGSVDADPVLNCVFDPKKPFHRELKKLIDIRYNSIFANYFGCQAFLPADTPPEDTYLNNLYLRHGGQCVSLEELEYAFSELFSHSGSFVDAGRLAGALRLEDWSLDRVVRLRRTPEWQEYIELLEQIYARADSWQVDFSGCEELAEKYCRCFARSGLPRSSGAPGVCSFRLCIGSKVMDLVWNGASGRMKLYDGAFSRTRKDTLSVRFFPGDITVRGGAPTVSVPALLFDGMTESRRGAEYFGELKRFFLAEHGFTILS
jgi:hypothetical protein